MNYIYLSKAVYKKKKKIRIVNKVNFKILEKSLVRISILISSLSQEVA